ncbi:electron transfer flavoprotein [Halorhodospira halochloris]|uniref:Electron transfer flavoprotein n=1 Tax=Halorhodospira halochloris TaxID=1052 RepID=A0A0X8XA38_HALHR|nr:electron transfer flavoprotein subunit alpha/FixB family protein [Halorhodospira halochloris]MBK1651954.1 electron transfer flavoprotein subunit alpha [Halorhodospira halochloris]BAU58246.1 electron transfer flavoprotein [Halorhodospira halochloris]
MSILVVADHNGQVVSEGTWRAVGAAQQLADKVDLVVAGGDEAAAVAAEAARIGGLSSVLLCSGTAHADQLAEPLAQRLAALVEVRGYSAVVAPACSMSRDSLPRLAAQLDVAMLSDVLEIEDSETFVRPMYGGSVLARLHCAEPVKIMTVRATSFKRPAEQDPAPVEEIEPGADSGLVRLIEQLRSDSGRPDLASAQIVVAGGRGLIDEQGVAELEAVADSLGAAIGASRGAVDAGLLPSGAQVGLTAKVVAPQLYIAVGISGAIYHISGMKESSVIVAINSDPEAPIFEIADYIWVADAREALAELRQLVEA